MKKHLSVLLMFILVFSFQACEYFPETGAFEKDEVFENKKLDIGLSKAKELPKFEPILEVFPTIDIPAIYLMTVEGKLNFVNNKGELVDIPENAVRYSSVFEYEHDKKGGIQCYTLYSDEDKMAIMAADGNLKTEFKYDAIHGENGYNATAKNGLIIVGLKKDDSEHEMLYGLVGIESGNEVVKCEYDDIFFSKSFIIAHKSNDVYFLDYSGSLLTKKENAYVNLSDVNSDAANVYTHDPYTGDIYLLENEEMFDFFEDFTVLFKTGGFLNVYNKAGSLLYSFDKYKGFFKSADNELCVVSGNDSRLFFADGEISPLPFSESELLSFEMLKRNNDNFIIIEKSQSKDETNYIESLFSLKGEIISRKNITGNEKEYIGFYSQKLGEPYIVSKDNEFKVMKDKHNNLISKTDFDYVWFEGDYIIGYALANKEHDKAEEGMNCEFFVYDKSGALIADKLFGVVRDSYNDGKIFVYKEANKAGFLNQKAELQEVQNLPEVMIKYNKG